MFTPKLTRNSAGFTLVELLTVIAIIAILMGILFPTIGSAIEGAKKAQAKNDEQQLITAIKAYYTEYGHYPVDSTVITDYVYGGTGLGKQNDLMNVLRYPYTNANPAPATVSDLNPRKSVFLDLKDAKNFGKAGKEKEGIGSDGKWLDPWGNEYLVQIDADYDNSVKNPGYTNAGKSDLNTGVIVWTYGRDAAQGKKGNKDFKGSDDVLSWQ